MDASQFGGMLIGGIVEQLANTVTLFPQWAHEQPILWIIPIGIVLGLVEKVRPRKRRRR
jgi:cytochrome c-type biogenesis protein CcmH/NrfF